MPSILSLLLHDFTSELDNIVTFRLSINDQVYSVVSMKPKTYHQLTMTEIAKQKKPNAPSKSKFMSDIESSLTLQVTDAVDKSMEKLQK